MKFVVTDRAPKLGKAGSTVEMTKSQAAYERLRGHVVEPAKPTSDAVIAPAKGKRRK